jgi:uncharacterized protein YhaN
VKITDIHVDGFGVWNTMSVDELSDGVTLFFGRNEAGKTTLMQFIRAALYGFSSDRRRLYLPPVHGGIPGGMLRVQNHSGEFVVERRQSETDPDGAGRAIVLAQNGSRQGQHLLNVLLSGVDETIFNNVFAIGIRELQELASLNDTQAAEQLYNLASGVDRVSIVEVMRNLATERDEILSTEGKPAELTQLLAQRERLKLEIGELEAQTRRWFDLGQQRTLLAQELTQLEATIAKLERDSRVVGITIQVRDKWRQRQDVLQQLHKIGPVEPLPDDCLTRLDDLNLEIEQQKEFLAPLQKRRIDIKRELTLQPINRALWEHSSRIEAICEHGPWIASLENEIQRLQTDIDSGELELLKYDEELAAEGGVQLAQSPIVSSRVAQQLDAPAHSLREAIKTRVVARKQHKKTQQESKSAAAELQDELEGRVAENFDEQLTRSGELVKQLRRRVHIEDRLEQTWRQRDDIERENDNILDEQLSSMRMLIAIGIMFVFGFVLLMTGLFGSKIFPSMAQEVSWGVGSLGLLCILFSAAWKAMAEKSAQDELETMARRIATLDREIEDLVAERTDIDRDMPAGGGTFSARLVTAEKELKELEVKAPLHMARQDAKQRTNSFKRHVAAADDEMKEARSRWRRALRNVGLPESLTPKHVRQLAAHHQKKSKVQTRVAEFRDRLTKLQTDRDALVQRLHNLNQSVGLTNVAPNPQLQLSQLATALDGQRDMVARRRELKREEREVRQQLSSGSQKMRRLLRAREAMFAELRVTDEDDLRARWQKLQEIGKLNERRKALTEQISAIIGGFCPEEEIAAELGQNSKDELEKRYKSLLARLQESQNRLGQMYQRRGEINQEMKSLAENRRLAAAKFELGCVEQQIKDAVRRWQITGVTIKMLEVVRERYEAERQPETLSEASLYLEKLTDGKYVRIWTPLGEHELRVDDHEGRPLSIEVLSRGTREAVFLSLRLALVAAYGRRGVNIPMVLDDVLVNLDRPRSIAAVRVLRDFSKEGRQLLFFTCHEHIQQMFEDVEADIRVLPGHGMPGVHVKRQEKTVELPVIEAPTPVLPMELPVLEAEVETIPISDFHDLPLAPAEDEYVLRDELAAATTAPLFELEDYLLDEPLPADPLPIAINDPPAELDSKTERDTFYSELDDDDAFDDGLWWETSRRNWVEEEPAA